MGKGRAGHIHHGGQILQAFLTVAQQPEQLQPVRVGEAAEKIGNSGKIALSGHILQDCIQFFSVLMRQLFHLTIHLCAIITYYTSLS